MTTKPDNHRVPPPSRAFPPLGSLRAFDAVVSLGSIRAAADALTVNYSTISRHLRTLEAWTGATLVTRLGSATTVTDEGRRYHELLAAHIDGIAAATLDLLEPPRDDLLKIFSPPAFAIRWLMPRLDKFRDANPGLAIELLHDDIVPNLARNDADVAIEYVADSAPRERPAVNLRQLELTRQSVFPVASPGYLAGAPPIARPTDLLGHPLIREDSTNTWGLWLAQFGLRLPDTQRAPRLWRSDLTLEAARRGHGIAMANWLLAKDDLENGRLAVVTGLGGAFASKVGGAYVFLARSDRWHTRSVARFRHWLVAMLEPDRNDSISAP